MAAHGCFMGEMLGSVALIVVQWFGKIAAKLKPFLYFMLIYFVTIKTPFMYFSQMEYLVGNSAIIRTNAIYCAALINKLHYKVKGPQLRLGFRR